jgi:hypothetical protein
MEGVKLGYAFESGARSKNTARSWGIYGSGHSYCEIEYDEFSVVFDGCATRYLALNGDFYSCCASFARMPFGGHRHFYVFNN